MAHARGPQGTGTSNIVEAALIFAERIGMSKFPIAPGLAIRFWFARNPCFNPHMRVFAKTLFHAFGLSLAALMVCALSGCGEARKLSPKAVDGVLDLSDWNFEQNGHVELGGEWRFVDRERVQPMALDAFRQQFTDKSTVPAQLDRARLRDLLVGGASATRAQG